MTAWTDTAATFFKLWIDVRGHRDAQLRQHVLQGLNRKRRLAGLIAAAVQADHESVADQLVGAHTLHLRHVLDALGLRERCGEQAQEQ